MENIKKSFFEKKIKPCILYIGAVGALFTTLAYIVIILIMIFGFKATSLSQTIIFSIVNAVVGLLIMQLLKIQGMDFAKNESQNETILKKYNTTRVKKKTTHSLGWYWFFSSIKDILIKGLGIMVSTGGLIYIVVIGSQDYNLLLLALVNILMFICFGLLALVNAYDFFNEKYIPYLVEKLEEADQNDKKEDKEIVAMVETEHNKQRDIDTSTYCRDNLLESSVGTSNTSNSSESVVLDNSNECDTVLGRTIYTSNTITNDVYSGAEEIV